MTGIAFYMLIYTHLLKRHSVQNIVIGGAAGSIPPLVGWAAVTGDLGWIPWILFAIIFLWTPPHFWALALMIKDDYAEVDIPMMPVVKGEEATSEQIWLWCGLWSSGFDFRVCFPEKSLAIKTESF
jgi:protoheme IX farnesyltransferase